MSLEIVAGFAQWTLTLKLVHFYVEPDRNKKDT